MNSKIQRHPIRNFLIKKDEQLHYIVKIVMAVFFTSVITLAILAGVYYLKSGSGYFYFMSSDLTEDLQRQSILGTILPSLVIAEFISVLLGIAIGLFSSRKFAVPIYKIEQWVASMLEGNISAKISFREKQEFQTLTMHCNALSDYLTDVFGKIDRKLEEAGQAGTPEKMREILQAVRQELPKQNPAMPEQNSGTAA